MMGSMGYGSQTGMMGGRALANASTYGGMACANCHGADGRGGRYLAMGSVRTPDIRYSVLTNAVEVAGETQEPVPYTDETLKQAITQGVEPDGETLKVFMPRWSMSEKDMSDLIEFLKTL
jgi:mono/diheme cytochrome c family protein